MPTVSLSADLAVTPEECPYGLMTDLVRTGEDLPILASGKYSGFAIAETGTGSHAGQELRYVRISPLS